MYAQPTQPLSIAQLLDSSFRLFRASWTKVWWFGLAGALVLNIWDLYGLMRGHAANNRLAPGIFTWMIFLALYTAIFLRQESVVKGVEGDWEFSDALRQAPRVIAVYLLAILFIVVACAPCFFIIGVSGLPDAWPEVAPLIRYGLMAVIALTIMVYVIFAPLLIVVEEREIFESLSGSFRLVARSWWRTALPLLMGAVVGFIGVVCVMLILQALPMMPAENSNGRALIETCAVIAWQGLTFTPFVTSLTMVLYYDLKLRKEGTDLTQRIEETASHK